MTGFDMTDSIIPRSDQLNAEDMLTGPRTVTIREVNKGTTEQPVNVELVEYPGRPFKPSKTVRRILVAAWGPDASTYAGHRMTLFCDPTVRFGGQDVGGIRVSHLSHIAKPLTLALTITRGKRAAYVVQPLKADAPTTVSTATLAELTTAFEARSIPEAARLAGVNRITGGSATALEVLTETEARQVLASLNGKAES